MECACTCAIACQDFVEACAGVAPGRMLAKSAFIPDLRLMPSATYALWLVAVAWGRSARIGIALMQVETDGVTRIALETGRQQRVALSIIHSVRPLPECSTLLTGRSDFRFLCTARWWNVGQPLHRAKRSAVECAPCTLRYFAENPFYLMKAALSDDSRVARRLHSVSRLGQACFAKAAPGRQRSARYSAMALVTESGAAATRRWMPGVERQYPSAGESDVAQPSNGDHKALTLPTCS